MIFSSFKRIIQASRMLQNAGGLHGLHTRMPYVPIPAAVF